MHVAESRIPPCAGCGTLFGRSSSQTFVVYIPFSYLRLCKVAISDPKDSI